MELAWDILRLTAGWIVSPLIRWAQAATGRRSREVNVLGYREQSTVEGTTRIDP